MAPDLHRPLAPARGGSAAGPHAALAAALTAGAWVSWRAWANLIVDCGRELQVPERLLGGALLYRDVRYFYGPLAPYLDATLYALLGVRVEVLAVAGLTAAALTAWGVAALARGFAGPWAGAVAGVAFVGLCAFSNQVGLLLFAWPVPYAYPATYGMTAAVWSLALLLAHLRSGGQAAYLGSAALLAVVALTKLELVVALLVPHLAVAAMLWATDRLTAKLHLPALATAIAVPAGVYAGFFAATGPALWADNLGAMFNPHLVTFSRNALGLDDPVASLRLIGQSALLLAALAALAAWTARAAARREGLAAPLAVGTAALSAVSAFVVEEPLRALPLVLLSALGASAWRAWRDPGGRDAAVARLALHGFALACLARIALRVSSARYGFVLLVPGLAALAVVALEDLPAALAPGGRARWPARATGAGLLLGAAAAAFLVSARAYDGYTDEVVTLRGRLRLPANGVEAAAVRRLAALPPGTRALAIPEGAGLVFMAGLAPVPDGMSSYLPIDLYGRYDEASLIARWEAVPPEVVVLVRRPLPEYGSRGFGADFGVPLASWLSGRYQAWGDRGGPVVLARPRQVPAAPAP